MTLSTSAKLTIFEGPDGSGKTTAAKVYAEATGARYVHFPALPRVGRNLGRMYVEAMLPALLGYQDVVFDRCWLSEVPYGSVFREGQDRLTDASRRMLERLAFRCGAVVVMCLPPFEVVRANYTSRRHLEMLDNAGQLLEVYKLYAAQRTYLPVVNYDYTQVTTPSHTLYPAIGLARTGQHHLKANTAGNSSAKIILVGETFAERKDCDPWYQWPFASFSSEGCSQWLTDLLEYHHIGEDKLLWVNADMEFEIPNATIIALGAEASSKLSCTHEQVPHPQYQKRVHSGQPYPLINLLREIL